jgi:hypothetical protein
MPDSRDAIELEVQRRLADYLASAGVPQGRISLEVLYMLPPDFVRAYRRLFDAALLEGVVGSGGADAGRMPAKKGKEQGLRTRGVTPDSRGKTSEGESRGSSAGARSDGKRYRTHWSIRDEKWFRVKGSVDRKLKRLAREMELEEGKSSGRGDQSCGACGSELGPILEALAERGLRRKVKFCPWCGVGVEG